MFNKTQDQFLSWKAFDHAMSELERHRYEYSDETKGLISTIKMYMTNGMNDYAKSTKIVYDWTGTAVPYLTTYVLLFSDENGVDEAEAQKCILLDVLDEGLESMKHAQNELSSGSTNFNEAAGRLTALRHRLTNEFGSKIEEKELEFAYVFNSVLSSPIIPLYPFYKDTINKLQGKLTCVRKTYNTLKEKVAKASSDAHDTKNKLKEEIREIGELKVQTKETKLFITLDRSLQDIIIESVNKLINKCNEYRLRYIPEKS